MRDKYAIIVAAGKGLRMKHARPKQFLSLLEKPLLYYTIHAFITAFKDVHIILVLPEGQKEAVAPVLEYFPEIQITTTSGGATRFQSVKNGLQKVNDSSVVFIHDGVRPLVSSKLIQACYEQTLLLGSAIPALEFKDSIRSVKGDTSAAIDRSHFRIIQTPQTFLSELILPAFDQEYNPAFTDEATVVEHSGNPIHLIDGEEQNIKITRPLDLQLAGQLLLMRNKA